MSQETQATESDKREALRLASKALKMAEQLIRLDYGYPTTESIAINQAIAAIEKVNQQP